MKIFVDPGLCKSQARCYTSYPDLFDRGELGKGVVNVKGDRDEEELTFEAQEAANICPRGAIKIEFD